MRFERILALTDLSDTSTAGLLLADSLARRVNGGIVVGYAHTRTDVLRDYAAGKDDARRLADWVREEDEEHLRVLAGKLISPARLRGVESVEAASARDGVGALIERVQPDLVCMATHGRTGVGHLLLGSTADHTLRTAEVPVMVTKGDVLPDPSEPLRVLIGVDLIEDPAGLARQVATFLDQRDAMVLAHVVPSLSYSATTYGSGFAVPDVPRMTESAREHLKGIRVDGAESPMLSVELTAGRPGEGLLALERRCEPDLVVALTHGRRGFDRLMLGSVSEFLARKCSSPVLVFPS